MVSRATARDVKAGGTDRVYNIIGARAPRRSRDIKSRVILPGVAVTRECLGCPSESLFRMVRGTGYLAMNSPPPERLRERGRSFHTRLMRLLALSLRYEIVGPEADLSEAPFLFASLSATSFPVTPARPDDQSREMERFQQDTQTVCTKRKKANLVRVCRRGLYSR
jgi:hypothetical protein